MEDNNNKSIDGMSSGDAPKLDTITTPSSVTDEINKQQNEVPKMEIKPSEPEKKKKSKKGLVIVLCLILIAGAAGGMFVYRQMKINDLQSQVDTLTADKAAHEAEEAAAENEEPAEPAPDTPTEAPVEKSAAIEAAITSGKYADLKPLMADSVTVILAASEGLGARTPDQAVADLKYLDTATDPWNFKVNSSAQGQDWRTGDYASYFPLAALAGESANNYVVSFQFNDVGDIAVIFMTNDSDLL